MRGELLLTVGRVRVAWHVLAASTSLDRAGRRPTPAAPDADQVERLDYLAFRDRGDRFVALRDRRVPTGPKPSPIPAAVLDVRARVDQVVSDTAAEAYRVVTGEALRIPPWSQQHTDGRVLDGLGVLAWAARHGLVLAVAVPLAERLDQVAAAAESAAGLSPVWVPVRQAGCPACGLPTLRVRQDSPSTGEWVAECRDRGCVCRGPACPCGVLERATGRRHVWARDEWPTLAALGESVTHTA